MKQEKKGYNRINSFVLNSLPSYVGIGQGSVWYLYPEQSPSDYHVHDFEIPEELERQEVHTVNSWKTLHKVTSVMV
jgi:hypothetical protein